MIAADTSITCSVVVVELGTVVDVLVVVSGARVVTGAKVVVVADSPSVSADEHATASTPVAANNARDFRCREFMWTRIGSMSSNPRLAVTTARLREDQSE